MFVLRLRADEPSRMALNRGLRLGIEAAIMAVHISTVVLFEVSGSTKANREIEKENCHDTGISDLPYSNIRTVPEEIPMRAIAGQERHFDHSCY